MPMSMSIAYISILHYFTFFIFLFYSKYSGKYKALVGDKHIHTYNNSGSFGELALLYNMPR